MKVPFSTRYQTMQSYPDYPIEMRELPPFEATLRIVGMQRGQSVVVEDTATRIRYPLFLADMLEILDGVEITGKWKPCKRGTNYGIRMEVTE